MKHLKQNAGCIILVYLVGTKATRLKAAVHYAAHSLSRGNLKNLMPRSFAFATPQLNPPPRAAWQNQQQRNGQGFRGGNANQSDGTSRGFFQPQGRNNGNSRPQTPPNLQQNRRQFQQRPTTPPMPARPRRGSGCHVCGDRRCHTEVHRRNGTLPPDFRRIPPAWNSERNLSLIHI